MGELPLLCSQTLIGAFIPSTTWWHKRQHDLSKATLLVMELEKPN